MDRSVERSSQDATGNDDGGGKREGTQVNTLAAARPAPCTTERREERSETIQGAGEKICHAETEGHVGAGQGMEDGSNYGGEEIDEGMS